MALSSTVFEWSKLRDALLFWHLIFIDTLGLDIQPTRGGTCGRLLRLRTINRAHHFCPNSSAISESHVHARKSRKCNLTVCLVSATVAKVHCSVWLVSVLGTWWVFMWWGILKLDDEFYLLLRESIKFEEASDKSTENRGWKEKAWKKQAGFWVLTSFNSKRSQSNLRKPMVETQSWFLGQYNKLGEGVAWALGWSQGLGQIFWTWCGK